MARRDKQARTNARPAPTTRAQPAPWDADSVRRALWAALALGVLCLIVYVRTLSPSVPFGDAAELLASICSTGVPHPPGYPLFIILGKLFTWLPLANVAWRVNLLCALCDAVAAGVLSLWVSRWSRNIWAGVLAGGLFAFSAPVWTNAVATEVFALNNLLVVVFLYLAYRFHEVPTARGFCILALVTGLGLSNHHTFGLFAAPVLLVSYIVLLNAPARPNPATTLLIGAAFGMAGLLPYLYLPLAGAKPSMNSWGDFTSLGGIVDHILRRETGTFRLMRTIEVQAGTSIWDGISYYIARASSDSLYAGMAVAALGVFTAITRGLARRFAWLTLGVFAFYTLVFHSLANIPYDDPFYLAVQTRFWQQPQIVLFAWVGLGFAAICAWAPKLNRVWAAAAVAVVLVQLGTNFREQDQSGNWTLHQFGTALLEPLPQGALFITRGDVHTGSVRYLQTCEGVRPDVSAVDREILGYDWYQAAITKHFPRFTFPRTSTTMGPHIHVFALKDVYDANTPSFRMFATMPNSAETDKSWMVAYDARAFGLLDEIFRKGDPEIGSTYPVQAQVALQTLYRAFEDPGLGRYRQRLWDRLAWDDLDKAGLRLGYQLVPYALEHGVSAPVLKTGIAAWEATLARGGEVPLAFYKDLGIAYESLLTAEPQSRAAIVPKMLSAWEQYVARAPADDPQLPAVRAHIAQYK